MYFSFFTYINLPARKVNERQNGFGFWYRPESTNEKYTRKVTIFVRER